MAILTTYGLVYLYLLFHTGGDFLQRELERYPQVAALDHRTAPGTAAPEARKAETAENIPELAENIFHAHAAHTAAEPSGSAHARMAKLVVTLLLFRIAQNPVGFRRFLELFFRLLVTRIAVRMIFERQFAVRLLDFVCRSALGNPQHFVIISFFCHRYTLYRLTTHHHFGKAQHLAIQGIPFLNHFQNKALLSLFGRRNLSHRLRRFGIERLTGHFALAQPLLF